MILLFVAYARFEYGMEAMNEEFYLLSRELLVHFVFVRIEV